MKDNELTYLLSVALKTAHETSKIVLASLDKNKKIVLDLRHDVKIKGDQDAGNFISEMLYKESGYPVISEEDILSHYIKIKSGYKWIIDPIDGSLNFLRGIPICCISIALWDGNTPLLGVVYDFNRKELFSGIVGKETWLNKKVVKVSKIFEKSKAVLLTGFPTGMDFSKKSLTKFIGDIKGYKKIRLLGSAALSLAYVSCGRADFYHEKSIKIWDVAAGIALVIAAGGIVKLNTKRKNSLDVMASNGYLLKNQ